MLALEHAALPVAMLIQVIFVDNPSRRRCVVQFPTFLMVGFMVYKTELPGSLIDIGSLALKWPLGFVLLPGVRPRATGYLRASGEINHLLGGTPRSDPLEGPGHRTTETGLSGIWST